MKLSHLLALIVMVYSGSASAFRTVAEYEKWKGHPEQIQFLYGVMEGFMLSQAIYRQNNRGTFYCPPEQLQFSQNDYARVLDQEISTGKHPPAKLISLVLIESMVKKYPCGRSAATVPAPSTLPGDK